MSQKFRNIIYYTVFPATAGMLATWLVIWYGFDGKFGSESFTDALVSVGLLTLFSMTLSNILRYYRPGGGKEWTLAVWILIFSALWWFLSFALISWLSAGNPVYEAMMKNTVALRLIMSLIILTCMALVTWIRRQSESDARSAQRYFEIQQLAREAELNSLRQQLQPHFLFNSLNSIQALTRSNSVLAGKMVIQLSDYLRGTMVKGHQAKNTVTEELEHTQLYLEIEKVRFGERLQVQIQVSDGEIATRTIPALVLQPLVENAIKHGIYQNTGPVLLSLTVGAEPGYTVFEISNPYDPSAAGSEKSTGFGLSSLKRRLFLLYGQQDLIRTHNQNNLFTVNMKIPT